MAMQPFVRIFWLLVNWRCRKFRRHVICWMKACHVIVWNVYLSVSSLLMKVHLMMLISRTRWRHYLLMTVPAL